MMSAKYFEYYTFILRGLFFRGHTVCISCASLWCYFDVDHGECQAVSSWSSTFVLIFL